MARNWLESSCMANSTQSASSFSCSVVGTVRNHFSARYRVVALANTAASTRGADRARPTHCEHATDAPEHVGPVFTSSESRAHELSPLQALPLGVVAARQRNFPPSLAHGCHVTRATLAGESKHHSSTKLATSRGNDANEAMRPASFLSNSGAEWAVFFGWRGGLNSRCVSQTCPCLRRTGSTSRLELPATGNR